MSWVRIDDHANEHPKLLSAGAAACWLWACGLMYCNRQKVRTGVVPSAVLPTLGVEGARKLAERLVAVGLWEPIDGGYRVHDYHEYQPTTEQQAERKAKRAEAGRLGGQRSGEARRQATTKQVASSVASPVLQRVEAKANPDPDPDPDPREIPPTPASKPAPPRELMRLGLGGFEVEEFLSGVADATGRRPASPSFLDRQHVARGIELCPLPHGATSDEVLAWIRSSTRAWADLHTRAGKVQFQRGWHPAKWVEWLSAGCPDPNAATSVARQRVDAAPTALPSAADNDAFWREQEAKDRAAREQLAKRKAGGQ